MKYYAVVSFVVHDFDAKHAVDADNKIRKLIDELVVAETTLTWDDVQWDLVAVEDEE